MLIQTQHSSKTHHVASAVGGQGGRPPRTSCGLLFADHDDNGQMQQPPEVVEPDIPTNLDDLTDDELAALIRSLLAQAAVLYQSGSLSQQGGAK